ncbi:uncharacterized protein LOC115222625 isoform X1 [Octopus sinensis]|uniref:Uncharacterized protein LOC115222625 isoform X1 n=2 Tax=Octopus sinensis TaxID=2607531 RepID=A0A6P7TCK2_9MOLL|nr:uncharacterized protein LOC115222625 isoform X1 [Octopus sinensis]
MILGPESSICSLSSMSANPPGFGQFSNNNYMPGIGNPCVTQFVSPTFLNSSSVSTGTTNTVSSAVSSPILSPPSSSQLFLNYGGLPFAQHIQTGFTFTSPTQSYSLMGSPSGAMLPGGVTGPHLHHLHHYNSHIGGGNSYLHTSTATTPSTAPGVGVTWQHTVPSSMPWVQANSITPNPVCFSDVMSSSSILTGNDPKPSCSCSPRRPKRRGTDMYEETDMFQIPPNKVCLSEEKVARQLQELSISPDSYSCLSRSSVCDFSQDEQRSENISHWQAMNKTKENQSDTNLADMDESSNVLKTKTRNPRSVVQDIIDEDEKESSENKTKRSLHIWEDLSKDILAPKNVLPRKIIEEIISTPKPCLDVVLWRPPDVLANVVKQSPENTFPSNNITQDQPTQEELPKSALNFPDISLLPFTSVQDTSNIYKSYFSTEDDVMDI